ncbi:MAG TPA: cytochrome c [Lacunisphaera sp.]|jgi:cytochrome c553|nr:cytochrome c [Lacunisphaera sp.]HQY06882.1 cytochrome c [Lacunisphaera sp.]
MKKFLKIFVSLLAGLAAVVVLVAGMIYWQSSDRLARKYTVQVKPAPALPVDAVALARGRHLAETRGCVECHGADYGGAKVVDDPGMGLLCGPNLTRGQGGLPSDYNDTDWERAIRHGVARDGRGLFLMPSADYARFTARDMSDLIAHLKSVPPVNRARVPLSVGPVARALLLAGKIKLAADEIDHKTVQASDVVPGVTVAYGHYLAASCTGCHGATLAGGKIDIGPPDWPPASNLTPHASGRLAKWSEADFVKTLRTLRRPDGSELNPAMPRVFSNLNDVEVRALWAYLQTLPALATGTR